MSSKTPRVVDKTRAYSGWNTLDVLIVETTDADGATHRHRREVIDHGTAAAVLVVDRSRATALMVRQWRAGLHASAEPYLLEAPAGLLDPGETPEGAARREVEEELGIKLGAMRGLGSIVPSAGTLTERVHLFIAELSGNEPRGNGGGVVHEGEAIEIVEVPLDELFEMARNGAIEDAKTLILVQRSMLDKAGTI
jgi:nudix-type nucleoside diphosphatase (YffH/AdpP family)